MMRLLLLPTILVCGLAACSSEPEQKADGNMTAEQVAEQLKDMKIEPGQWEATNEILSASAPGVPADALKSMVGQKSTVSNCITPEQAAKPSANFLAAQQSNNCTYQDWNMDDGKMTGTMTCQGGGMPGKVIMKMTGDYGPTAYNLDMDMNTTGMPGNITMNIKAKTTGRRVGECTRT
jgi:hypothetical protein